MLAILIFVFTCVLFQGAVEAANSKLPIDENGRLKENVLLVRDTASKKWQKLSATGRTKIIVTESDDFLASPSIVASCLWKGFPIEYVKDSINTATENDSPAKFGETKCDHLELGFISYFEKEVLSVTWVRPDGQLSDSVQYLKAGEKNTLWIHTVPSHKFLVKGKTFEQEYTAEVPSIHIVGTKPDYTTLGRTITEANKIGRVRQELFRVQKIKRVFTDVGFKKIMVPRNVWGEISTYWHNNRNNRAREEWLDTGFFVNWHEVNQDLVVPPFVLKRRWQELFKPVVEEWTNTSLEPTDIYGIRTYYDGAWLSNHVDREQTHAASAIINMEQIDLQEPWEVHIWDIYGKRQRVSMKPGEALLYESARCMHGRPVPLRGKEYSNIFVHYRPVGKPKWYTDPEVGKEGPDITSLFNPEEAVSHEIGWVGEFAREKLHGTSADKQEL